MASAIMHLCIASELNKRLKKTGNMFFLGSIAPDLSKQVGSDRTLSHFGVIPDIDAFIAKYPKYKMNDFDFGYFVHLYSDVVWFDEYFSENIYRGKIKFLSGKDVQVSDEDMSYLVYSDYTNLNKQLIDYYNLDLDLFFNELPKPNTLINEIDVSKLQILVDKMGLILTEANKNKEYIFDINFVVTYINDTVNRIIHFLDFQEVDMHMHTTHSDGESTVKEVLEFAEKDRLAYFSITDHDRVSQYKDVKKYRNLFSGKIIAGCELTTTHNGVPIEILGYGFDIKKMQKLLKKYKVDFKNVINANNYRIKEFKKRGIKVGNDIDATITYSENDKFFLDITNKENINKFFRNEVANINSKFFVDVSHLFLSSKEIIDLIHEADGLAVVAHPGLYNDKFDIESLICLGLDGIECFYPAYTFEQTMNFIEICKRFNLLISGGSDYHGACRKGHEEGVLNIDAKYITLIQKIERFI